MECPFSDGSTEVLPDAVASALNVSDIVLSAQRLLVEVEVGIPSTVSRARGLPVAQEDLVENLSEKEQKLAQVEETKQIQSYRDQLM
jgi:hypothetical protein